MYNMVNIKTYHCISRTIPLLVKSKGKDCEVAASKEEFGLKRQRIGKYQTPAHELFRGSRDVGGRKNIL